MGSETTGTGVNRRQFVKGLATVGAVASMGWGAIPVFAEDGYWTPPTLTGNHFELTVDRLPVNFTGKRRSGAAVNGSIAGPTLRWREGEVVTVAVTNKLKAPTSIHWHGVRVPSEMDGVPGLSFAGIMPGERFVYRIPVLQSGTYWYHSHSGGQEQTGMSGALILERKDADAVSFDREYVVLLTDWTDTDSDTVLSNLKQESEYYNYHQRTAGTFLSDVKKKGLGATLADRRMWGRMNMTPTDISDVSGATYTYLLNGNAPHTNWTGLYRAGERVRLRFINGSAMTFFDVRIPGLPMTVVQSDGNDVEPVTVDEFRLGLAETYDVIVEPKDEAAYTIFAQTQDRTGYARGTLAPRSGMAGAIPPMDPRPVRTMMDMGMSMSSMKRMDMSGMMGDDMKGMDMSGMKDGDMKGMDMSGMKDGDMKGMDMSGMMMGNATGTIPFPQPGPRTMPLAKSASDAAMAKTTPVALHLGPMQDQISMAVKGRLDDPGDGLTDNGRQVLTYSALRARYGGVDGRPPSREIELHLTGNMERYIWGFNGKRYHDAEPIRLKLGERVRFVLINDTMMDHPIHLHGLWSELENGHGEHSPYKHTVIVKPSERVSYLVSADTPGRWAFHCHLMYHMDSGMFREVVVA
jgi:CopA family copper-resistance protein